MTSQITAPSTSAFLPDIATSLASAYGAAGRSPRTVEQYTGVLRGFSAFLLDLGRSDDPDDIRPGDLEDWVVYNRTTRSDVTARSYFMVLRACWTWMRRRGLTANDPFIGIANPTADERVIEIMTDDDVRAILATTDGPAFTDRRDRAMILLACDSGLRRIEMSTLRLIDVDLVTGRALLRSTKAGRDRAIPMSDKTRVAMRRYIKDRERLLAVTGHGDPGTLFTSRVGDALTVWGVHRIFAHRAKQAGVKVDRPVHGFRSWFAVRSLESGANESAVMSIAGWRSGDMLRRYVRSRAQEIALTAHAGFSPVSGL